MYPHNVSCLRRDGRREAKEEELRQEGKEEEEKEKSDAMPIYNVLYVCLHLDTVFGLDLLNGGSMAWPPPA